MAKRKAKSRRIGRSAAALLGRFYKDGGLNMAASISYFSLMSLIPLVFALFNLSARMIGRSRELQAAVLDSVRTLYPMLGETLTREINRALQQRRLGWVSIGIFLWLGSLVFSSIEYSIGTIFKTGRRRHFFVSTALSFGMVMAVGVFMAVSFWAAYLPRFIISLGVFPGSGPIAFLAGSVLFKLMAFTLIFLAFTALYKFLPGTSVPVRLAARGGLVAAVMWEASKYAFGWYVVNVAHLGSIYGSLTAIIIFLLWIYYSSVILLLVAEMVHMLKTGELA